MAAPSSPPPHRLLGFPTFPPPLLWPTLRGVTRQREAAPSFVSAGSPREGSSSRSPPAHTSGVSKELETRQPPPLRPPPADPRPFLPLGAAPPAPAAPPPPRRPLCLGRLSASSPPRPRGETGLPPETKTAANTDAAAAEGASREGARASDTHTPPHARGNARGPRWTPGATSTSEPPAPRRPLSTSRPGLSLPRPYPAARPGPQSQAPCGPTPPGVGGPGRKAPRRRRPPTHQQVRGLRPESRRGEGGAEARRLRRRPRRPDAGPGPSRWPTRGASDAQASAAAAAFQLSPKSPSLREGLRVAHALPSPPDNMAPGPPSRAGGPLIPLEEPGWERGGQGGADARLRRPGRTRVLLLWGRRTVPSRRDARRCVCVAFSLGGCGLTPPPVSQGRASAREKKTFIETLQPAAAEKGDRLRELPPPALEPLAAGSATPAGGRGGGGA